MVISVNAKAYSRPGEQLGLEMEMVVADFSGETHAVNTFFSSLRDLKRSRGVEAVLKTHSGRGIAVDTPLIHSSLDNAFNNLESAIGPVQGGAGGLVALNALVQQELEDVLNALAQEGATLLNFSEHPNVMISPQFYAQMRAPKPIYDYWVGVRGWNHSVGIDAKAQNGPTTAVSFGEAIPALNVILALAPAFIALFANSPFEHGELTGLKENRLTIWPRMFSTAVHSGDRKLQQLPDQPFTDLRGYFAWMFGPGTAMQAVPQNPTGEYKAAANYIRIDGDPCILDFMGSKEWNGKCLGSGKSVTVQPSLDHLSYVQFAQFLDARIRYGWANVPSREEFLCASARSGGLEDLLTAHGSHCYIEGRAPGANFPDLDLLDEAGDNVAASCVVAASAMQAGLLRNLSEAQGVVNRWGWRNLGELRGAAIASALEGEVNGLRIADLCREVLDVAERGLDYDERWMLAYPRYVCETGQTGADRAISLWDDIGPSANNFRFLCQRRMVALPNRPDPLGLYPPRLAVPPPLSRQLIGDVPLSSMVA